MDLAAAPEVKGARKRVRPLQEKEEEDVGTKIAPERKQMLPDNGGDETKSSLTSTKKIIRPMKTRDSQDLVSPDVFISAASHVE